MNDSVTKTKFPEIFEELCQQQGIEHKSTVHHFARDSNGIYQPVFWSEITLTPKEIKDREKIG